MFGRRLYPSPDVNTKSGEQATWATLCTRQQPSPKQQNTRDKSNWKYARRVRKERSSAIVHAGNVRQNSLCQSLSNIGPFCTSARRGRSPALRHSFPLRGIYGSLVTVVIACAAFGFPRNGTIMTSPAAAVQTFASSLPSSAHPTTDSSTPKKIVGNSSEIVRISVIAPLDQPSIFSGASWRDVLEHMARRLQWTDATLQLNIHDIASEEVLLSSRTRAAASIASLSDIVVVFDVNNSSQAAALAPIMAAARTSLAVGSTPSLSSIARISGIDVPYSPAHSRGQSLGREAEEDADGETKEQEGSRRLIGKWLDSARAALSSVDNRNTQKKRHAKAFEAIHDLYHRRTSDDLVLSFLVLVNEAVRPVPEVANSTKRADAGMAELECMVSKCGKEIFQCLFDASCRTALNCLNACTFNDQVCSYRCIASYESAPLEAFSLCILQKHNCLGLSASIPEIPDPAPMSEYRGNPLTHEGAEDLLMGWLRGAPPADEPFSWRVFGGKNAAYDSFPCQFQLFFRGKARNSFWYQPIFKVLTLGGGEVWRDRLYRVRRGTTPGSFHLSVLDNGVVSLEHWRVLDCDEGLEWCAFYYSGAAGAAGLSYTGAILTSRNGEWPENPAARSRIYRALDRAGIKPWELTSVDNSRCENPPLVPADVAV